MWKVFNGTALLAALVMSGACTVHETDIPSPTGPSEFGVSVVVAAVPDIIKRDGAEQSLIIVTARGIDGAPVSGLQFRVDTVVGFYYQDFGTLASRFITTGSDGRATVVYTAPPPPPVGTSSVVDRVTIVVAPVGSNHQAQNPQIIAPQSAEIRLVPPSVIIEPGSPVAFFTYTPAFPAPLTRILFNGTGSVAESGHTIVSYTWYWGDGETGVGSTQDHDYPVAGTYVVTLVVQDDIGRQGTASQAITVATP